MVSTLNRNDIVFLNKGTFIFKDKITWKRKRKREREIKKRESEKYKENEK